ncbi:hypothetical protein BH24ACT4_BH24ACT4_07840 [soil metagenome]
MSGLASAEAKRIRSRADLPDVEARLEASRQSRLVRGSGCRECPTVWATAG